MQAQSEVQLVLLRAEGQLYGIEIERLQEVVALPLIRRVPGAPEYVVGVMHLRGRIMPVMDLRLRIGLRSPATEPQQVAVAQSNGVEVGIVVDEVEEIVRVPFSSIRPVEDGALGALARSVAGVVQVGERHVLVLDLDLTVLRDEIELEVTDEEFLRAQ